MGPEQKFFCGQLRTEAPEGINRNTDFLDFLETINMDETKESPRAQPAISG